jgi:hypothetical protein
VGHTRQLPFTEKYLLIFEEDLKKAKEPDGLIKAMKEGVRRPMLSTSIS